MGLQITPLVWPLFNEGHRNCSLSSCMYFCLISLGKKKCSNNEIIKFFILMLCSKLWEMYKQWHALCIEGYVVLWKKQLAAKYVRLVDCFMAGELSEKQLNNFPYYQCLNPHSFSIVWIFVLSVWLFVCGWVLCMWKTNVHYILLLII